MTLTYPQKSQAAWEHFSAAKQDFKELHEAMQVGRSKDELTAIAEQLSAHVAKMLAEAV